MKYFFIFFSFSIINSILGQNQPTAIATYENISLYWAPSNGSADNTAEVYYKKTTDNDWIRGHDLWYDDFEERKKLSSEPSSDHFENFPTERKDEYRGSIVNLESGTTYNIEVRLKDGTVGRTNARTWTNPQNISISKTVTIGTQTTRLSISDNGTENGYIKYTFDQNSNGLIDVNKNDDYCIYVDASYIIIDGLTLRNSKIHAIYLTSNAHDVIIRNCDIANWGEKEEDSTYYYSPKDYGSNSVPPNGSLLRNASGWAKNDQAGIFSESLKVHRITIENNIFKNPNYTASNWSEWRDKYANINPHHPRGSKAIFMKFSSGNNVIRYNQIFSDNGNYFNDGMGGWYNYSYSGFPGRDSDIYGNEIANCYDDAIEADGGGLNVRIYNNYINKSHVGISLVTASLGPVYVFRNIKGSSSSGLPYYSSMFKMGGKTFTEGGITGYFNGGKQYLYHNTSFSGNTFSSIDGGGGDIRNLTTRNNLFLCSSTASIVDNGNGDLSTLDLDYDIMSGKIVINNTHYKNFENNGRDESSVTFSSVDDKSSLLSGTNGFDDGIRIYGFNDNFSGTGPDIGAVEASFNNPQSEFLKVYLEGPFLNGNMQTFIQDNGSLPQTQPYLHSPWNLSENTVNTTNNSLIVDWLIVELRSSETIVNYTKTALLNNVGIVLNADGKNLSFNNIVDGNYFIVIKHRNHLDIMSSIKVEIKNNQLVQYDFTDSQSKAYGKNAMATLDDGIYGLYAGDSDKNNIINNLDFGAIANSIPRKGYDISDLDLNNVVNVLDYNKVNKNILKSSQVPK